MDDLLHRLRHDMVELSSQGEHFTHQIWLMYGQFEQVVDQLNSPSLPSDTMDAQTRVKMNEDDDVMNSSIDLQYFSDGDEDDLDGDSLSDDESLLTASLATHHHYGRSQTARMNPLLETISVIEFDSDDGHPPLSGPLYTGSVDSGYKSSSCCPTPDPSPAVKSELDLDHLTSLRRTLLTAIERYDSRTKELIALPSRPNSCQSIPSGQLEGEETGSGRTGAAMMTTTTTTMTTDQTDGAGTRFSRMARCMLEIIEDLQRQQQQQPLPSTMPSQQQQQPTEPAAKPAGPAVPPKPIRSSKLLNRNNHGGGGGGAGANPHVTAITNGAILASSCSSASSTAAVAQQHQQQSAPATPPRVARRGRRKLPTPQPPPDVDVVEENALSGADYHLYEEILYDLTARPSWHKTHPAPPPLPARPAPPPPPPSRLLNAMPASSKGSSVEQPSTTCTTTAAAASAWALRNVMSKPLRRDRNNQLIRPACWSTSTVKDPCCTSRPARSNVYTFGSNPTSIRPSKHHHHHPDDEYGFRAAIV